ncbi:MAG: multicopper oxidase family protein [bacterium]|nr:multicopper oxidase family protein [bacterium]
MSTRRVLGRVLVHSVAALSFGAIDAPAQAQSCDAGSVAQPASFDLTVRPALAEDVDPADDVVEINLTAREAVWGFGIGSSTAVWTYNSVIPGPMIEAEVGDTLIVNFCNDLPRETTVHWHGVETPANMDGSNLAQLTVEPGGTFRYEFPLLHAGTFWYHPHVRPNVEVERGLYGALIVRDPASDALHGLPQREHVFIVDDLLMDPDGQIPEPFTGTREQVALEQLNGREGNLQLLNGIRRPDLTLEQGVPHRIRVINVANARFMRLSVPDHPFWRIGGDQGLLEEPIEVPPAAVTPGGGLPLPGGRHPSDPDPTTGLLLTPGERADILFFPLANEDGAPLHFEWHDTQRGRHSVDFLPDGTVALAHNVPDGTRASELYATILLTGEATDTEFEPPTALRRIEAIDATGAPALPLVMGHTFPDWQTGEVTFFIQEPGKPFPMLTPEDVHTVRAGGIYVWEVKNLTGGHHNFHTHGFGFQHIETEFVDLDFPDDPDRNFVEPASHLENKDTFLIKRRPGTVPGRSFSISRLAVTFDDTGREGQVSASGKVPTATRSGGWLAHCHILEHSGNGMMTFFQIVDIFSDGFESGDFSAWALGPRTMGGNAAAEHTRETHP